MDTHFPRNLRPIRIAPSRPGLRTVGARTPLPALLLITLPTWMSSGCTGALDRERNSVLRIDGSSTVFPLTEAVVEEFRKRRPDLRFTITVSGTGGGFRKFLRGEAPLIGASRPISRQERQSAEAAGITFLEIPVALDGIVLVVNERNDWCRSLRMSELKTLWEAAAQGRIVNWSQIRPEWPDQRIRLFGPGVDSGTYDSFSRAVVGIRGGTRGDFTSSEDDHVLVRGVIGDLYGLGFFSYSYYHAHAGRLRVLALERDPPGTGWVHPDGETIRNGQYTPLTRLLFLYMRADLAAEEPWSELLEFYLELAPRLAEPLGFAPLTEPAYTAIRLRVRQGRGGTLFDGEAVVSEDRLQRIREGRLDG